MGLFLCSILSGQNPLKKEQYQINAGVGLSSWGSPIYAGIDYGVHTDISAGGEISFRTDSDHWDGKNYSQSIVALTGNANYHFNNLMEITPEWDFYAGLHAGFFLVSSPEKYHGDRVSQIGVGLQVGGRYYFTDKAAINLEFLGGSALAGTKLGISIKL